jgi:hypothetical protein
MQPATGAKGQEEGQDWCGRMAKMWDDNRNGLARMMSG